MGDIPFIAVEGPIGVGKTSLAKKIASQFNFHLLKEIVEENPFLDKFYDDIEAWSFQTEMFFLCNRYKQLEDVEYQYLKHKKPVVADYHIMKNMIFAKRTLSERQFDKYEQIYQILVEDRPRPNLLIYLDASLDTLLQRIDQRGRSVEEKIQSSYLEQLRFDYQAYMDTFERKHPNTPIIRINGDQTDFIKCQADLEKIFTEIKLQLNKGAQ